MVDDQQLLKEIARKEIEYGFYDAKVDGLPIYSLIRFHVRYDYLKKRGAPNVVPRQRLNKKEFALSAIISLCDFAKIYIFNKHYSTVFFSFPRLDKIGPFYLDKYTDPLIEEIGFNSDYLILDHGRAGAHPRPRLHSKNVVYLDVLSIYSKIISTIFWSPFYKKYRDSIDQLNFSMQKVFNENIPIKATVKLFYSNYIYSRALGRLFHKISAKRLLGPARSYMVAPFYAANSMGIKTFELQHGVTFDETSTYTGFQDIKILPRLFLAFGDNKPLNVYGIDESKIVNIGWALQDYLAKLPKKENYKEIDVLAISDPECTDAIFDVVLKLAQDNPKSTFYIRPHPHDIITEQHLSSISKYSNIKIQDKSINIAVVLQSFTHIIGENSTVLYEALAMKKKVGRLFYEGFSPKYLEESDKSCFWEIHNQDDFHRFIREDISTRKNKSIYSKFNKKLFCKVIGL